MKTRRVAKPLSLMKFIPRLSPRYAEPRHLAAMVSLFDRIAAGEEVHAAVSKPPRHGGTEAAKHGIAQLLLMRPELRVGIAMHSSKLALKKSREIRELYVRGGGRVRVDAAAREDWRTGHEGGGDGGVWAGGTDSGFVGEGFDLLYVDDPIRGRAQAESAVERDRLWDWWQSVAMPRLEPNASSLVIHHRWHVDDMIGRLVKDGVEAVNLPAIDAEGRALWPERYSLDALRRIRERIGEYAWASLYQGQPFVRGGALFHDVQFYDALPSGLRFAIGVDFAYSTRSRSDYSTAVVLGEKDGAFYVVDVLRMQVTAPEFRAALEALCARYGGVRPFAWIGGTEKGVIDMWRSEGFVVESEPATVDKFTRAQPVSAAWGAGKVLLPRTAEWLDDFVAEVCAFTGVGDRHDDLVDALASAHHKVSDLTDVVVTRDAVDSFMRDPDRKWQALSRPILVVVPPNGRRRQWLAAFGRWAEWLATRWEEQWLWVDLKDADGNGVLGPDGNPRRKIAEDPLTGAQVRDPAYRAPTPFFVASDYLVETGGVDDVVPRLARSAFRVGAVLAVSPNRFIEAEFRRSRMLFRAVEEPGDEALAWLEERVRGDSLRMEGHFEVRGDVLRLRGGASAGKGGDRGWGEVVLAMAQADLEGVWGGASPTNAPGGGRQEFGAEEFARGEGA